MNQARKLLHQMHEQITTADLKAARPGDKFYYLDGRGQVRSVTVIEKLKKLDGVYHASTPTKMRWGVTVQYDHHIEKAGKLNSFGFTEKLPPPTTILVGSSNKDWFKSPQELQADWADSRIDAIHGQKDRLSRLAAEQGNDKAMDRAAAERASRIEQMKKMMQGESLAAKLIAEADFDDEDMAVLQKLMHGYNKAADSPIEVNKMKAFDHSNYPDEIVEPIKKQFHGRKEVPPLNGKTAVVFYSRSMGEPCIDDLYSGALVLEPGTTIIVKESDTGGTMKGVFISQSPHYVGIAWYGTDIDTGGPVE